MGGGEILFNHLRRVSIMRSLAKILLGIALSIPGMAGTLIGNYDGKFGIFGTIVKGVEVYHWDGNRYILQADARAVGLAAPLSRHLEHHYRSEGRIVGGKLYPNRFIQIIKRGNRRYKFVYTFDHLRHKIYKARYLNGKLESNETLSYWTPYDVMSLYFSLPSLFKPGVRRYTFFAVGARKRDGRVDITLLTPRQWEEVDSLPKNPTSYYYLKVKPYNKELGKEAIYLLINRQNFVTIKSIFPDYLLGGDLVGVLTSLQYRPE